MVHLYGIRHHGPGSARALRRALERLGPDLVLVEGPPDADSVIGFAAQEAMQPPVALMVYALDRPEHAAFYPFATFSPEWQALRFALSRNVPVRFMDLPQAQRLALTDSAREKEVESADETGEADEAGGADDAGLEPATAPHPRHDPLGQLAAAAGYADGERWWDQVVESRREDEGMFEAIQEAMVALREEVPSLRDTFEDRLEARIETLREAAMRETIRRAEREGFERIAVVCGAWHVPALLERSNAKADEVLLKGLPKIKVSATWTPWTYGRLTQRSGYGAGILSPGWYDHLWHVRSRDDSRGDDQVSARWLTQVAILFREQDLSASSAHIIEGVRLADSLAALRGKSAAGLEELNEAVQAVFCGGRTQPLRLVEEKLIVGERLGAVPEDAPMLPLQQDLTRLQKSLRMQPKASEVGLELDLRKEVHLKRSHLLHRLRLLHIPWGEPRSAYGKKGSFHEHWLLRWQPEFAVRLVEVAVWGNTVERAASAFIQHEAAHAPHLPALTALLEDTLLADLPDAVAALTSALEDKAALTSDVTHLMAALPPLVQVLRYGNVRKTDAGQVAQVLSGLAPRLCIGLPGACNSLDDDAANAMFERIMRTHSALRTLADERYSAMWTDALRASLEHPNTHALVAGRAARLLFDTGDLSSEAAARRVSIALSRASEPADAAAWIEGFLRDSGAILLHDEVLWRVLDGWLQSLREETFVQLVPLLRRTFSTFAAPERRQMGERVRRGVGDPSSDENLDEARAQAVMPTVRQLLGIGEDLAEVP